ncbi:methyltransferase family protein [Bacillota bacterium Meth-B3]
MRDRMRLLFIMLVKGMSGLALMGLVIFGAAGSLRYAGGWMLIGALAALMLGLGLFLWSKHPDTLKRRLKAVESERAQKGCVALIGLLLCASFALAGLDHRLGWTTMPMWTSFAGLAALTFGYGLFGAVILQNAHASRVVEVQAGQAVIATGLYAVVRHPMYLASLMLFLSMPFVLASYAALPPMLLLPFALALRIRNEEAVLAAGLAGYPEYMQATRYRLIPYIW